MFWFGLLCLVCKDSSKGYIRGRHGSYLHRVQMLRFLRSHHSDFHSNSNLHLHQQCRKIPITLQPYQHLLLFTISDFLLMVIFSEGEMDFVWFQFALTTMLTYLHVFSDYLCFLFCEFISLDHFWLDLFFLWDLICFYFFIYLGYQSSIWRIVGKKCFLFCRCIFLLFIVIFHVQKLLNLV